MKQSRTKRVKGSRAAREGRMPSALDVGCLPALATGVVAVVGARGRVYVDYEWSPDGKPVEARSTVPIGPDAVGREVVLGFANGDPCAPIVLGVLRARAGSKRVDLSVDRRKVTVRAENELVLRCGDASITLTRAGQVLIQGRYVLTRASGVNRVQGASIQLN